MIPAHGGRLVNRIATGDERDALIAKVESAPRLPLNARELSDLEMIGTGAMSPLDGFMGSYDLGSVIKSTRLASGVVWPLPVTLSNKGLDCSVGTDIALTDEKDNLIGFLHLQEKYSFDKLETCSSCFLYFIL